MSIEEILGLTVARVVYPASDGPMSIEFDNGLVMTLHNGLQRSPTVEIDGEQVEFNA